MSTPSPPRSPEDPCHRLSYSVGVAEDKNQLHRPTMEDVHTYVANWAEQRDWGYFAVFDGHAGKQAALWCGQHLHGVVEKDMAEHPDDDFRDTLNRSFQAADASIKEEPGKSGCTAAVCVLRWEGGEDPSESASGRFAFRPNGHTRVLYTANVGDSRIVLSRGGVARRLSYDHKGSDINELARITAAGGLMLKGRVNGMLAVTRLLGDAYMKELVVGTPFLTATVVGPQDGFIVVACDGLWDVCSDQQAVDVVEGVGEAQAAAQRLVDFAMERGTMDNVTVMVVMLDGGVFGEALTLESGAGEDEPGDDTQTADVADVAEGDVTATENPGESEDAEAAVRKLKIED